MNNMITLGTPVAKTTDEATSKVAEVCAILDTYNTQLVASNGTPYYEVAGEPTSYWFYINTTDVNIKQLGKTVETLSHDKFLTTYTKKGA